MSRVDERVLLVHLARADVLRTREVYADLTALRWGANRCGWEVVDTPSLGGAFAELWRTHSRWDLRRASLNDPAPLFGVRPLPMFLTGTGAAGSVEVGQTGSAAMPLDKCARWWEVARAIHLVGWPIAVVRLIRHEYRPASPQEKFGPANSGRCTSSSATSRKDRSAAPAGTARPLRPGIFRARDRTPPGTV